MHANMNFPAPFSVLGFIGGFGGLVLGLGAIAVASAVKKQKFVKTALRLMAVGAAAYFALLLGFSLASHQVVLARGEEKYFCEIDCHLAYSVVEAKAVPEGNMTRYLVILKTRFDETTISPQRPKDLLLTPNARAAYVVDAQGRQYGVISSAGIPLTTPLKPGELYTTTLAFDVPSEIKDLHLLLASRGWENHLLIGDENSWLHRKTYFAL